MLHMTGSVEPLCCYVLLSVALAASDLYDASMLCLAGADLSPPEQTLLVQQGGTLAFEGNQTIFRHDDSGILK